MSLLTKLKLIFSDNQKDKSQSYSDLSSATQKKILIKSIREANQDQRRLSEEFKRKFKTAN